MSEEFTEIDEGVEIDTFDWYDEWDMHDCGCCMCCGCTCWEPEDSEE